MGAIVNIGGLYLLVGRAGWPLGLALPAAIQLALLSNFLWNNAVTFRSRSREARDNASVFSRLLRYEKLCLPGAVLNGVVTFGLARFGFRLLVAAFIGIVAGTLWNFVFTVPSIWRIWGDDLRRKGAGMA
jgi:dolichol-phosphate mannosyltransferase